MTKADKAMKRRLLVAMTKFSRGFLEDYPVIATHVFENTLHSQFAKECDELKDKIGSGRVE